MRCTKVAGFDAQRDILGNNDRVGIDAAQHVCWDNFAPGLPHGDTTLPREGSFEVNRGGV